MSTPTITIGLDIPWLRREIAKARRLTADGLLIHGDSIAVWVDRAEALADIIQRRPQAQLPPDFDAHANQAIAITK